MKSHLLRNKGRYVLLVVMLLAVIVGYAFGHDVQHIQLVSVARGTVRQEVLVTGVTKPTEEVTLGFERSGKVTRVHVRVGETIPRGALLVELDAEDLYASRLEAQARLEAAQARLQELRRGSRPEEIRIEETKVRNASIALMDAREHLLNVIRDAYTTADDAVRNQVDPLFSNPRSSSPRITVIQFPDRESIEFDRVVVEHTLTNWQSTLLSSPSNLFESAREVKTNLLLIARFLDRIASGANSLNPNLASLTSLTAEYAANVSRARTAVNSAITGISSAEEKLRGAQSALSLAEEQLALTTIGPREEVILSQEASVKEAEARVRSAYAQIAKTILRAPISGVVVLQEAKVGEIVNPNVSLVGLMGEGALFIEANIPEIDIGRIVLGNLVSITLDALPDTSFRGVVTFIEPTETIVDGVVNFTVKISLESNDSLLKSGLTANLTITTLEKTGVLVIPQFAILETEEGTFVKQRSLDTLVTVPVTLGIRGNNGMVEIIEGLKEGDEVVVNGGTN